MTVASPSRGSRNQPSLYTKQAAEALARSRMQAMAELQQMQLFKKAAAANQRLAAGDAAYQDGNIRLAATIFTRLASSQPRNEITMAAADRLAKLAQEARSKIQSVDGKLDVSVPSTTEDREKAASKGRASPEAVQEAFAEYDEILSQYGKVLAVKKELSAHVSKQRRQFADILNEKEAKELWDLGQEHEKNDQLCCAYQVYQQAARLAPAESGLKAKGRFETLKSDPKVVAAAESCRELRECHKVYQRASLLTKSLPVKALDLYADILRRAPKDSDLFRQVQLDHDALKREIGVE